MSFTNRNGAAYSASCVKSMVEGPMSGYGSVTLSDYGETNKLA
jgi:hypothetical protein